MDELMDAAAPEELRNQISQLAARVDEVAYVQKCMVRRHGYWFYVDLHIHVDPEMTVARSHAVAHEVKDRLRSELPRIRDVLVHIEPSRKSLMQPNEFS
jgi:divalent metal cation (Fe/Co/Zn/Cd) transporter